MLSVSSISLKRVYFSICLRQTGICTLFLGLSSCELTIMWLLIVCQVFAYFGNSSVHVSEVGMSILVGLHIFISSSVLLR
jgi:hypothetical protein